VASAASARIASSILVFAVLTVVVVPLTVRLPVTAKSLPYVMLFASLLAVIALSAILAVVTFASVI